MQNTTDVMNLHKNQILWLSDLLSNGKTEFLRPTKGCSVHTDDLLPAEVVAQ